MPFHLIIFNWCYLLVRISARAISLPCSRTPSASGETRQGRNPAGNPVTAACSYSLSALTGHGSWFSQSIFSRNPVLLLLSKKLPFHLCHCNTLLICVDLTNQVSHAETSIQLRVFQCTGPNIFESPSSSLRYKYSNLHKWVSHSCKHLRMSNVWFSRTSPVRPHWIWATSLEKKWKGLALHLSKS